ncbi:MAG: hypothetical protein IPM88_21110 [Nitrospira sp.]|nr:hypothetical protein [Nitrospira sp.]
MLVAWVVLTAGKNQPVPTPIVEPPRSPYETTVAATGIIEAGQRKRPYFGRRWRDW